MRARRSVAWRERSRCWGPSPIHAKTYGSVLGAMLTPGIAPRFIARNTAVRTGTWRRIRHGRQNYAQCGAAPFHFEFPSAPNRPRLTADGAPYRRFSHGWGWDPEDVGNLGQEGRTPWRKQAHAWLELDLAAWAGKLNDGISEDRRLLRSTLMRWLADPDLAALCEPGALKMLPVEERDEWLALWKGVDALIKRAIGA